MNPEVSRRSFLTSLMAAPAVGVMVIVTPPTKVERELPEEDVKLIARVVAQMAEWHARGMPVGRLVRPPSA